MDKIIVFMIIVIIGATALILQNNIMINKQDITNIIEFVEKSDRRAMDRDRFLQTRVGYLEARIRTIEQGHSVPIHKMEN